MQAPAVSKEVSLKYVTNAILQGIIAMHNERFNYMMQQHGNWIGDK